MTENIKKLLELASNNEELKSKLNKVAKEEVIAIAKEHGIELTDADLVQSNEVSDDELNAVGGGKGHVVLKSVSGNEQVPLETMPVACILSGGGYDPNCRFLGY